MQYLHRIQGQSQRLRCSLPRREFPAQDALHLPHIFLNLLLVLALHPFAIEEGPGKIRLHVLPSNLLHPRALEPATDEGLGVGNLGMNAIHELASLFSATWRGMNGCALEVTLIGEEEAGPEESFAREPDLDCGRESEGWRDKGEPGGTVDQTERDNGMQEDDAGADEGVCCGRCANHAVMEGC